MLSPDEITCSPEEFTNYAGMDSNADVQAQVDEFVANGFLKPFDSLEACTTYLGPLRCSLALGWSPKCARETEAEDHS